MSGTGTLPEAHASFRFAVRLGNVDQAVFTECTLPSLEVEVHEQREGGYNMGVHLLPGPIKAGRITLKRGLTQSSEMLEWYKQIVSGTAAAAQKQVEVVMYDSRGGRVLRLSFEQAYPVKWTGPSFNSGQNAIAIETLELAFSKVEAS